MNFVVVSDGICGNFWQNITGDNHEICRKDTIANEFLIYFYNEGLKYNKYLYSWLVKLN